MKIFLTGGSGYIGQNFIECALKKKHKIFAPTRNKFKKSKKDLIWLKGDFYKDWYHLKKSDVLVHIASEGVNNKHESLENCLKTNLMFSTKLLFNAINAKCFKWIIISSCNEQKINNKNSSLETFKKKENLPYFNYALSKFLFTKTALSISKRFDIKCRVLKVFHVYGGKNEKKNRLFPSLISASKKNKNLNMSKGNQISEFCYVKDLASTILETLNFNIKNKRFPQEWDLSTGKQISVKSFAKKIWTKKNSRGKLLFNKIKDFDSSNYKSNKKKLWKIREIHQKPY